MGASVDMYMTSPLKNYDRSDRLAEIEIPVLFVAGRFDEAKPATTKYYQSLVPGSRFAMIAGAGHLTMQDDPAQHNKVIEGFLNSVEK